jgi:ABC-type nickel/cobalt efflux system permease component RcnA
MFDNIPIPATGSGIFNVIVWIVIAGLCFYLLWWLANQLPDPFQKAARVLITLFAVFLLISVLLNIAGCGAFPQNQESTLSKRQIESNVSKTTADIVDRTFSTPTPTTITVPVEGNNKPITVEVAPQEKSDRHALVGAEENAEHHAEGERSSSVTLPLSVTLLIGAIAFCIFAALGWLLYRSSRAFRESWRWFNDAVGNKIRNLQNLKSASTDPNIISALNNAEADLQDLRAEGNKD